MGTYFHGNTEIQGDGLQTLILMNPHLGYSDTTTHQPPPPSSFAFPNSSPTANATTTVSQAQPSYLTQQFVGIPHSMAEDHSHRPSFVHSQQHDISTLHSFVPSMHHYGLYNQVDIPSQQQGLSLTLSFQHPRYGSFRTNDSEQPSPAPTTPSTLISPRSTNDVCIAQASSSAVSSNGVQSALLNSKYLKAAQELLCEVVNVGTAVQNIDQLKKPNNGNTKNTKEASPIGDGLSGEGQTSTKREAELTTVERQEVHMKKAKLVKMLDEVEKRYRQYHNQMQIVISWFEQATGGGSAKPYTALALNTISKQFRCLKEAIMRQIQAASKSLGEEDTIGGWKMESSRLKFIDNQLRQQGALQQLGMIEHNAWRPKRGLPERSVSVLRAWLFEHFLHPYPKDSDKQMLAKQTGLTKSQVSNWFINARVRLWKPMVEDMYTEEIKEHEHKKLDGKTRKEKLNGELASKAIAPDEKSASAENYDTTASQNSPPIISAPKASTSSTGLNIQNHSSFSLIGSSEMEEMTRRSPKKQRGTDTLHSLGTTISFRNMKFKPEASNEQLCVKSHNDQRQNRDEFTFMGNPTNYMREFGPYPIVEFERLRAEQLTSPYSTNGVSLTLGLPQDEKLSMSTTNQAFLSNQNIQIGRSFKAGEFGAIDTPTSSPSAYICENMNIQSRKRFATQLLPDFVA